AGNDSRPGVSHPAALGSRRDGAVPARWSRADGARSHRAARRRGDGGTRRLPGARREGTRQRARLPDVALARAEALRAMQCRAATRASIVLAPAISMALSITACGGSSSNEVATWRADCPSLARPAPLSLDAAREAERLAARRHELRLAEAAEPGHFL